MRDESINPPTPPLSSPVVICKPFTEQAWARQSPVTGKPPRALLAPGGAQLQEQPVEAAAARPGEGGSPGAARGPAGGGGSSRRPRRPPEEIELRHPARRLLQQLQPAPHPVLQRGGGLRACLHLVQQPPARLQQRRQPRRLSRRRRHLGQAGAGVASGGAPSWEGRK